ncbi:hypothetical protein D3C72_2444410 [compost metagenome]
MEGSAWSKTLKASLVTGALPVTESSTFSEPVSSSASGAGWAGAGVAAGLAGVWVAGRLETEGAFLGVVEALVAALVTAL